MKSEVEKKIRAIRKELKSTTNENDKEKLRNKLNELKLCLANDKSAM